MDGSPSKVYRPANISADLTIRLVRTGVISGSVLDADGRPVLGDGRF